MAQAQVKLVQSVKHAAHAATSAGSPASGGPSLIKEIVYGSTLGVFVGSFWKMYHINSRRRVEEFYAALEKGELTIEAS